MVVLAAGCGRFGFGDGVADARSDGQADGPGDGQGGDSGDSGGGGSLCAQSGAMICDGFEQLMFDPRWTLNLTAGSAVLDSTRAFRGSASVHFHTNAVNAGTSPGALLRTNQGLAGAITGYVHLRAWVYFASPYPAGVYDQVLNVVNASTTGVSIGSRDGFMRSNDYHFLRSAISMTVGFPLDRWACLQLQVPSNVEMPTRVFVDGVEVVDIRLMPPSGFIQPAADHIYVGMDWVTTAVALPATDAWFDELIVDDQPTTCAQ
jgi:hypothetical protein